LLLQLIFFFYADTIFELDDRWIFSLGIVYTFEHRIRLLFYGSRLDHHGLLNDIDARFIHHPMNIRSVARGSV